MDKEEKILLIQCLLYDIRLNWGDDIESRINLVKKICLELGGDFETLAKQCDAFLDMKNKCGYVDGRFFREEFPYGYENMYNLHSLINTLSNRSQEFKKYAKNITYPDIVFRDGKQFYE